MKNILVTGGAGLIGSHTVDLLLEKGYRVRILDNLEKPTHLSGRPSYIPSRAEFIEGDIRSERDVKGALKGIDGVIHLAATGGFTPRIIEYLEANTIGTALMLQIIRNERLPIKKIVVASSVAVYGEGKYQCSKHGVVFPPIRPIEQMERKEWELKCPFCASELKALATDELTPVKPQKVYSVSKFDQERLVLGLGEEFGIPSAALRYFVTYGPRQSLSNPYTGLCSIFSTRLLNDLPAVVYEDGLQTRDFVYVKDVAAASVLVLESDKSDRQVYNVGTGNSLSVLDIAKTLSRIYKKDIAPEIGGKFRPGEVRHIVADIAKLKSIGFKPKYTFEDGIREYVEWIRSQGDVKDYFSRAQTDLTKDQVVRNCR
ncbi:MAG: SDR family NAD(P)-dependent oxidoreductase [Candidatus Omnitrophica bacterium]|nr:SDR family NAD(P)-dependent oxidoreductase [Candidatus Omnitrophota bacterium]MBU1870163.1 SDR family NAD(P)-dependent oxidoreductase [Candidatus Omnitrophota bacterium]